MEAGWLGGWVAGWLGAQQYTTPDEGGYLSSFVRISYTRRMVSSGMLRRVAFVRTDVSEELSASFNRVTRISEQEQS
jgi:hypothetical protein